jgi:hypothetical protein
MPKNSKDALPILSQDSRLMNSVVRSRKCKRPNAQKHGLFSISPIIPGGDPREFEELYAELIEEWKRLRKIELPQMIEAMPIVRLELWESVCVEFKSGPQGWTWPKKDYPAQPVYSRDYPPLTEC